MISQLDIESETVACPLCGNLDFEPLCLSDRYGMGITTVGCTRCGLLMTNPQPTARYLSEFYKHAYRRYYQKVHKPSLPYIKELRKDARSAVSAAYILENIPLLQGALILDIGASEGCMLHAIKAKRPDLIAHGAEPNPEFREFAGKHVPCKTHEHISSASIADIDFDLIIVNHVFEHVKDPSVFLKQLSQKLSRGGKLYLEVPDTTSYKSLDSLHIAHLFHYSTKSLESILRAGGFNVLLIERYEPIMHPASIRVIAEVASESAGPLLTERCDDGWAEIRRIGRSAWRYHLLRQLSRKATKERWRKLKGRLFMSKNIPS
jgi:2-polyprenyl-3-methyl-5-hydroxy-6-metoxy-1,4-benzoquinol methylase